MSLPYLFRWNRFGRKGQPCDVLARSRRSGGGVANMVVFGQPGPKNHNSILVQFADGHRMVTSGNAIRKAAP